jgi:hypothetical protein
MKLIKLFEEFIANGQTAPAQLPNPTDLIKVGTTFTNPTNIPGIKVDQGFSASFKGSDNVVHSFGIKNIFMLPNKKTGNFDDSEEIKKALRVLTGPEQDAQSPKCSTPADILKYYSKSQKLGNVVKYTVSLPEAVVSSTIKSDPTFIAKDFTVLNTLAINTVTNGNSNWTSVFAEDGTNYTPEFKQAFSGRIINP